MTSSFRLMGVESLDFSHAEKERTACKAKRILKITTILLKMVLGCRFEWKLLSFCEFAQLCKQFFLSQLEKNHVIQLPTGKNKGTCRALKVSLQRPIWQNAACRMIYWIQARFWVLARPKSHRLKDVILFLFYFFNFDSLRTFNWGKSRFSTSSIW